MTSNGACSWARLAGGGRGAGGGGVKRAGGGGLAGCEIRGCAGPVRTQGSVRSETIGQAHCPCTLTVGQQEGGLNIQIMNKLIETKNLNTNRK